jgi:hypothetical protein
MNCAPTCFLCGMRYKLHFDYELTRFFWAFFVLFLYDLSQGEHKLFAGSIQVKLSDFLPCGDFHERGELFRVALRCHAMQPHLRNLPPAPCGKMRLVQRLAFLPGLYYGPCSTSLFTRD